MKRLGRGIYLDTETLEIYITSYEFQRRFGDTMNDDCIDLSTSDLTKKVEEVYGSTGKTTLIEEGPDKGTPIRLHLINNLKQLSLWQH